MSGKPSRPSVLVVGADHLVGAGITALVSTAGYASTCRVPYPVRADSQASMSSNPILVFVPALQTPEEALDLLQGYHSRAVLVSPSLSPLWVWSAGESGIGGFVHMHEPPALLLAAIEEIAAGRRYHSPGYQRTKQSHLVRNDAFFRILSRREQQILAGVCRGEGDEQLGNALGISHLTVATHRRSIRQKISAHNDRDLVRYAIEWGLHPFAA